MQSEDLFVDVRVTLPGRSGEGLPFSSTRAFAGRFAAVEGGVRWHVELDSDGPVPRTDGAAGVDLVVDPGEPLVMVEDAPGRFREVWERPDAAPAVRGLRTAGLVAVQVGEVYGAVWAAGDGWIAGRVWRPGWSLGVGRVGEPPAALGAWVDEAVPRTAGRSDADQRPCQVGAASPSDDGARA